MFRKLLKTSTFKFSNQESQTMLYHQIQRYIITKDYSNLQKLIYDHLFIQKQFPKMSPQYYNLLLVYAKTCFHLRQYEETEVGIDNCVLLLDYLKKVEPNESEVMDQFQNDMKNYQVLFTLYANEPEYEFQTLQQPEQYSNMNKKHYLNIHFSDVESSINQQQSFIQTYSNSGNMSDLYETYQNISSLNYFKNDHEEAIKNAIQALNLCNQKYSIKKREDLIHFNSTLGDSLQSTHTSLFLAQVLLSEKHEYSKKIALHILRNLQNIEPGLLELYQPKMDLLHCAYFFDHHKYEESIKLAKQIINTHVHPFFDYTKIQAAHIAQSAEKKRINSQRKANILFEDQIVDMERRLKIPQQAQHFNNLYTPLIEFFELKGDDLYEIESEQQK